MSEMITYRLFEASMTALSQLYLLTFYHAGILSFLSGLITPTIYFDKPEKNEKGSLLRRLFIFVAILLFLLGTLANVTIPTLIAVVQTASYV
ncbi:MFS transporter, partial [Vibrio parahaemolyticus]|nr:MFS transporter [Vibrio parahaemolyticus]